MIAVAMIVLAVLGCIAYFVMRVTKTADGPSSCTALWQSTKGKFCHKRAHSVQPFPSRTYLLPGLEHASFRACDNMLARYGGPCLRSPGTCCTQRQQVSQDAGRGTAATRMQQRLRRRREAAAAAAPALDHSDDEVLSSTPFSSLPKGVLRSPS